jgi:hypothetical protein
VRVWSALREYASLAHWLGLRVVATDDRPETVIRDRLPYRRYTHRGPVTDAMMGVGADQTHAVVVAQHAGRS